MVFFLQLKMDIVLCSMNSSLHDIQADIQRLASQQNQIQAAQQQTLLAQQQKQLQALQQQQQLQALQQQQMQNIQPQYSSQVYNPQVYRQAQGKLLFLHSKLQIYLKREKLKPVDFLQVLVSSMTQLKIKIFS